MNNFDAIIGFSVNPEIVWQPLEECVFGQKTRATAELVISGTSYDVALAMKACGCRPYLLGAVGADPFAQLLALTLDIPHRLFAVREKTCLASVEPKIRRHLSFKPPIINSGGNLIELEAQSASFLVVTGLMNDSNEVKLAHSLFRPAFGGTRVLNPREALCLEKPLFEEIAKSADWLFLNRFEAAAYLGCRPQDVDLAAAETFLARDLAQTVIITCDGDGALAVDKNGWRAISPSHFSGEKIDEKGAGDCFLGFFLSAVCKGRGLDEAFRLAVVAAGIKVTRPGTINIPTFKEVLEKAKA